jgi:hypothetical protein
VSDRQAMTKDELEQIQSICRQWMSEPTTNLESRLTVPSGIVLERTIVIKINALLTFDNVLIESAVDADTDSCYTKRIGESGKRGEFIDTPFEMIELRATQTAEPSLSANLTRRPEERPTATAIETATPEIDSDPDRPKFLLYSNRILLGYSLLERTRAGNQRKGRFHPSDDYFDYSNLFEEFPQAENDWMEVNAREAYGLTDENAGEVHKRFNELRTGIEGLKLYLADADGRAIETAEVRLEDLSRHYDDPSERWLQVEFL